MSIGLYVNDVLAIARAEIGYKEKATNYNLDDPLANAGAGNWTKYARDIWDAIPHFFQGPKNGFDWCTIFVAWCMYKACSDSSYAQRALHYKGPYGAGCGYAGDYYKADDAWYTSPLPGDQVFFDDFSHTGLVEKVENGYIYTIEGNAGNMVKARIYAIGSNIIDGYGRPIYDGVDRPNDFPFVDVVPDDWYYESAKWCYENGIIAGTDPTHFSPNKKVTRAELSVMLQKLREL